MFVESILKQLPTCIGLADPHERIDVIRSRRIVDTPGVQAVRKQVAYRGDPGNGLRHTRTKEADRFADSDQHVHERVLVQRLSMWKEDPRQAETNPILTARGQYDRRKPVVSGVEFMLERLQVGVVHRVCFGVDDRCRRLERLRGHARDDTRQRPSVGDAKALLRERLQQIVERLSREQFRNGPPAERTRGRQARVDDGSLRDMRPNPNDLPPAYLMTKSRAMRLKGYEAALRKLKTHGSGLDRSTLVRDAASELGWTYAQGDFNQFEPRELYREVEEVIWGWVTCGLVIPKIKWNTEAWIESVILTPRGAQLLHANHPCALTPSFAGKIAPFSEDVRARLEDAQECLRVRLLRPAVIMVGLAFETMIGEQFAAVGKGAKGTNAERIAVLQKIVTAGESKKIGGSKAARGSLDRACYVNDRRNNAAHATPADFEYEEVHDLIAAAPHWLERLSKIEGIAKASGSV